MEQLLDLKAAASRLGTHEWVLLKLTEYAVVPAIHLIDGWRFRAEELDHFIVASGLYRDRSLADRTMRSRIERWAEPNGLPGWRISGAFKSNPNRVPSWAQQGQMHFARFDGGVRHHEKAVLSNWLSGGMCEASAKLAREAYEPRALTMMSEAMHNAGITAAWVSWSLGFSLEHEQEQFDQCRRAIAALHEQGIKAFAYLSCNNFFWREAVERDPTSADMTLCEGGVHLTYEHIQTRRLANLRDLRWLELSKERLRAAIAAGVDGVFYDNCEAPTEDLAFFLPRIRTFLRDELGSNIPLMLNLHLYHRPQNFPLADLVDIIYNEWGFEHSGVDDAGRWKVATVRNPIRYITGTWPGRPMIYEMPRSMINIARPRTHKLHTLEAAAFGGEASRYLEGYMSVGYAQRIPEVLDVWKAIGEVHAFLDDHSEYFVGTESAAQIAVVLYGPNWCAELLDDLTRLSVPYDVIEARLLSQVPLDRYDMLLIPGGLPAPDVTMLSLLASFRQKGGKVIVVSDNPIAFERVSDEVWPTVPLADGLGTSPGHRQRSIAAPALAFRDALLQRAGPPHLFVDGEYVLGSLRRKRSERLWVLHLLNYHGLPATNVRVRLHLPEGHDSVQLADVVSPDKVAPSARNFTVADGAITFELYALEQYALIAIRESTN